MNMDFGTNKTPVEIIKEDTFGGTYFRNIYSSINDKWCRESWKEFGELKIIDKKYYCSNYYDVNVNMVLNVKHHEDFGKIMDRLILEILMVGFNGILDIG